jgi:uncharacterized protein
MKNFVALGAGFLFATGLGVAGMTDPGKVLAFLNLRGEWDPSLLFVMMGAIAVYGTGYRLVRRRARPVLDGTFHVPASRELTPALFSGSALFGLGWGLAGYCPGPALVSLATGAWAPAAFVAAMLAGMALFHGINRRRPIRR